MMPTSIEILNLAENKFTGGIPSEWGSLTNLKSLQMYKCGIGGACVCVGVSQQTARKSELTCDRAHRAAAVDAAVGRGPRRELQQVHRRHPVGVGFSDEPKKPGDVQLRHRWCVGVSGRPIISPPHTKLEANRVHRRAPALGHPHEG